MAKQRYKGQHAKLLDKWLRAIFFNGRVVVLEKVPDAVVYVFIIDAAFVDLSNEERDTLVHKRLREQFPTVAEDALGSLYHLTLLTHGEVASLRKVLMFLNAEEIKLQDVAHLLSHVAGLETWRKGFRHEL
jgi:hypothetical protein